MDSETLQKLVSTIDSLRREQLILEDEDPDDSTEYLLYPQPKKPDLSKLNIPKGASCPDSYRKFLRYYNGWRGFWPDWSLLGVPRRDNRDMYSDIKMNLNLVPQVIDKKTFAELPKTELSNPTRIFLPNHFIFGTDMNGSFLVYDRNRLGRDREPEIVWVHFLQHVEKRWANFEALLCDALGDIKTELKSLRKPRS